MLLCIPVPLKRGTADAGMVPGVIPADVILQDGIEFIQGMDLIQVKPVKERFTHGAEVSFHLGFDGAVPYRGM